jgi:peptidoglycan/LPS O-acetylase OafA/YrhL
MPLSYIKPLDGLRAFALFLIIIWHYFDCQIGGYLTPTVLRIAKYFTFWGWSGVDLFFVLSGFLIGRILICNRNSSHYFSTFYKRRCLRIFPPYYASLICFYLVSHYYSSSFPWLTQPSFPLFSYFFYIQNFWVANADFGAQWLGITWSLAIEEQFYLVFPVLVYVISPKFLPKLLLIGVFLAPFFRFLYAHNLGSYVLLPARMDGLLIGVLIAYFHLNGRINAFFSAKTKELEWGLLTQILIILLFKAVFKVNLGGVVIHSLLASFYGTLLIYTLVIKPQNSIYRVLSHPFSVFIGKISYTFYLTHQVFNGLWHKFILHQSPQISNAKDVFVTLLALITTYCFSAISYVYFEKPLLLLNRKRDPSV